MIETYRMLGREDEADLACEAEKWQQASLVQAKVKRRRPCQSLAGTHFAAWCRHACCAPRAAAGARDAVRTLQPLMHMALSAGPVGASSQTTEGERR